MKLQNNTQIGYVDLYASRDAEVTIIYLLAEHNTNFQEKHYLIQIKRPTITSGNIDSQVRGYRSRPSASSAGIY